MFIAVPVGVNYAARRYPVVTFSLIGINAAVYLIQLICELSFGPGVSKWVTDNLWLAPAHAHWYSYLTTMFVHADFLHLLGNMLYLFLFGSCVEDIIGRWQYSLFYLIGGLLSVFAYIGFAPGHFSSEIPLGGASGAVSACIGGFLWLFPKTEIEFKYFFWFFRPFFGEFEMKAAFVITFWFAKDFLFAVLVSSIGISAGVAFAAHIGGSCAGFGFIWAIDTWMRAREGDKPESPRVSAVIQEPASIYLLQGESQLGPYTATQVKQMIALGSIPDSSSFWQEGMPEWQSISQFGDYL